ncbi:hypothetical protein [Aeromonas hydrophila]|uniref:hypothetical protein n=1 Tax=Aeromonas hydrophila TaxID=644 RepID=UPI0013036F20|nr:hypothetical protein [Aeromonas hydrophila]QGZ71105.1 hypothetical protein GQR50_00305 [Aeromonas hydrophila]
MKRNFFLLALTPLLIASQTQAQTLSQIVTWQTTASKDSPSSVSLTHPGQQTISTTSPAAQVLAVRLTAPDSGLTFQARSLSMASDAPTVILNGKKLTEKYQSVPATEKYYLSYQQTAQPAGKMTESGYELVAYW